MPSSIREELLLLAEPEYQKFSAALIPGVENLAGVRIPKLRDTAKRLLKGGWQEYLDRKDNLYFEEVMLRGMIIGLIDEDIESILIRVQDFVPEIDNWSICDGFCTGLKITKKNLPRMWEFIGTYADSPKEYEIRFAVVMMLKYFVSEEYLEDSFKIFDSIKHDGYYAKMAVAWAVSIYYVSFPMETKNYLLGNKLDDFTHNKSVSKITELNSITKEQKDDIRKLKRKKPTTTRSVFKRD